MNSRTTNILLSRLRKSLCNGAFLAALGLSLLSACVRGQDASEVADLVLVRVMESSSGSAGTGGTTASTTVPPTFALTDNLDGTITVEAQNLLWAKCSQVNVGGGNMYNEPSNDCSTAAAGTFNFCATADDTCNGGVSPGSLDGGGTSEAWSTCANLVLGGRTDWRVPNKEELTAFFFGIYRNNTSLFDATPTVNNFWSTTSSSAANAYNLQTLSGLLNASSPKTSSFSVRCVVSLP